MSSFRQGHNLSLEIQISSPIYDFIVQDMF